MFNFTEGVPPEIYVDEDGNEYTELHDVIVIGRKPTFIDTATRYVGTRIDETSMMNSSINAFGRSLEGFGANSTVGIGNNIQVYWKTESQRPFYGNQYISTQRVTTVGTKIVGKTKILGNVFGVAQLTVGLAQDFSDYGNSGQFDGYNTFHAAGSWGASVVGMEAGLYIGGVIGSWIGGVGAIPGSIIGATIFGIIGTYYGGEAGGLAVDRIYGKW